MAISTATLYLEVGVVVVAVSAVLVGLYMLNRYMKRRGPELAQREGKSVLNDRAFNQVRIGQAAADRLARTGVDVTAAQGLLHRAELARAGGNYEMAIDLAKKAQDSLAAARSGASPLSAATPMRSTPRDATPFISPPGPTMGSSAPAAFTAPPTVPFIAGRVGDAPDTGIAPEGLPERPPKNKMEAHFQLELAHDELDQARAAKSRTRVFREADGMFTAGQAAYDKQDYTEALRLALKSRRTFGGRVEALPVSKIPVASPASDAAVAGRDPGGISDRPTFGQKCPKCGRTAAPVDQFCRGCGTAIAPALCSNCGAPLLAGDRFCGKCGATQN
ncbi:MAG: zinc ribbon domain-containing protein [Thermoplasmata archaeon]